MRTKTMTLRTSIRVESRMHSITTVAKSNPHAGMISDTPSFLNSVWYIPCVWWSPNLTIQYYYNSRQKRRNHISKNIGYLLYLTALVLLTFRMKAWFSTLVCQHSVTLHYSFIVRTNSIFKGYFSVPNVLRAPYFQEFFSPNNRGSLYFFCKRLFIVVFGKVLIAEGKNDYTAFVNEDSSLSNGSPFLENCI